MEGHEVPKNISEFEFHLIGDMTVRQFAYLGTGLGSAYLLFVFLSSSAPLVAWPLIIICALAGAAYAFLPISERPLDHWTASFFRAIYTPTQRSFKSPLLNLDTSNFNTRLAVYLATLSPANRSIIATPKSAVVSKFISQAVLSPVEEVKPPTVQVSPSPETKAKTAKDQIAKEKAPISTQPTPSQPEILPSAKELKDTVELAKQAQLIQNKIAEVKKVIALIKQKSVIPGADMTALNSEFQKAQTELNRLNQQAAEISHQLAILSKTPNVSWQKKIDVTSKAKPATIQLVLTTVPNIINGIVTDSVGNYLEGVIVVTHDKQSLPVRALKTNKLGQFLAATPLSNGVYTITLEKEGLLFDILEVKLEGQVIPPIRVSAKKNPTAAGATA
ncbi:PrgI family protein [Candidatus Daviesbacteria bacterium]|nr:PrgI family protein [Candidatus Daviesbacteria bacterium]